MHNKYRTIIYNNKLYFYNYRSREVSIINCSEKCLKDNKIYDLNSFLSDIKTSNIIKKIANRIIGEKLEIIFWNNYSEVDKRILLEIFNDLNFSHVEFKSIKEVLKTNIPNIIVSLDGIYYIYDIEAYFNYISHNDSILEAIDFIKENYDVEYYILIGIRNGLSLIDDNSYLYENNESFFEDLLKNMDWKSVFFIVYVL